MTTLEGHYFDGFQPLAIEARIYFDGQQATLDRGGLAERFSFADLSVSPRIGTSERFIMLPNNRQFACRDHPFLDSLPQESPSEGPVAWLEQRWGVALASVAMIIIFLLTGYFYGLPAAAKLIASRIPMKAEAALGEQTLESLEKAGWLKPSKVYVILQNEIERKFKKLCTQLQYKPFYQLHFRSSKIFGPNAFAFPGGHIVITDEMVNLAESPDEIIAILAHEIGHVEERHTLRSILQNSMVAAAIVSVTGDAATLSGVVAGFPMMVAQTKYSRDFETAADDFAFKLLKAKGYSPEAFASIMEKLAEKEGDAKGAFAYISTHPLTKERIKRARNK